MPTVSVVVPTYNRKGLVIEALKSIFAQTFTDYEIILIDDGSTDGTEEAIRPFADHVCYLRKANGGAASARNLGIREASGSFVAFLDSDDLWEANFLEVTARYLNDNADIALVSTGWRTMPSGHRWPPVKAAELRGDLFPELMRTRLVRTSAVMARRMALEDAGLFNERLEVGEDLDLWLTLAARHPTAFLNLPLSQARRHDDRLSKDRLRHLDRQIQVLQAHFDPNRIEKREFERRLSQLNTELGEAHLKLKDLAAARSCFKAALTLAPLSFRARRYLLKTLAARRVRG